MPLMMQQISRPAAGTALGALLLLAACAPADSRSDAERNQESGGIEIEVVQSGGTDRPAAEAHAASATRLELLPTGNEARYLVQEQLVGLDLPNDAVGRTTAVTGGIAFDQSGKVIPAESEIVIEVGGLTSDKERRDGYVSRRLLETETHPTVTLRPTGV